MIRRHRQISDMIKTGASICDADTSGTGAAFVGATCAKAENMNMNMFVWDYVGNYIRVLE